MELFQALGLNIQVLIAQLVNFAILLFVLWWFGYKPMMTFLDDRKARIEAGVKNAEAAEARLTEIAAKEKAVLKKAQAEAMALITKTNEQLVGRKTEMMAKAKAEINEIITKTKEELEVEKKIAIKQIKRESAELIIAVAEKVLGQSVDAKVDKLTIERIAKDIEDAK